MTRNTVFTVYSDEAGTHGELGDVLAKNVRFAKISGKTGECPVGDFELFPPKKT